MKTQKSTKDDWFAAASAHDLWASNFLRISPSLNNKSVVEICGASYTLYLKLLDESQDLTAGTDYPNHSFIATQLGLERAGLA